MIDAPPLHALAHTTHAHTAAYVRGPRAIDGPPLVAVTHQMPHPAFIAAAHVDVNAISLNAGWAPWHTIARKRMWGIEDEATIAVLIHEHLHLLGAGWLAVRGDATDRSIEEATVDAVSIDVMPRVVRSHQRARSKLWSEPRGGVYQECVTRVRVASTRGSRAKHWRTTAARKWRVRLLHSTPDTRRAMFKATGTSPAGVCPEAVLA